MNTTPTAKSKRWLSWSRWLFLAFAAVIGLLVLLALAVIVPIGMVKGWRFRRLADRRLSEEGRQIELPDAIDQLAVSDRQAIVELGPKGICSIWIFQVPSIELDCFTLLPTLAVFESDPRGAWNALVNIDRVSMGKLAAHFRKAIRVENVTRDFAVFPDKLKQSTRVISCWDELCPTRLLEVSLS